MYCPRFLPQVQLNRRHCWRFCTTFPQPLEGVVSCRKWKRTAAAVSSGGLTVNMVLVGSLLSWCQRSEHGRRLTTWTGLGCRCLSVVSRSVFSWSVLRLTVSRTFFKTVVPILLSLLTSETCDWFKEQLWKVRDVWMWVKLFRSHRHFLWWCYSRMSTEEVRRQKLFHIHFCFWNILHPEQQVHRLARSSLSPWRGEAGIPWLNMC